ncbi:hypothetical protein [Hymenobacter coccineus]|nr:hypothetical protein [Hymenobacter coccineus]
MPPRITPTRWLLAAALAGPISIGYGQQGPARGPGTLRPAALPGP